MRRTRQLIVALAVCALSAGVSSTASGKIIYVDDDATGANDGSSWTNAFYHLQDALTTAEAGDEIRVAQGTYLPTQTTISQPRDGRGHGAPATADGRSSATDDADRTKSFPLKNGVTVRGGYAGLGQADPDARDIALYDTILSGDLKGDDAPVGDASGLLDAPWRVDNSFNVVTAASVDSTAILDGFIITSGNRDDCWGPGCGGGGLSMAYSSATVENCTFAHNSANEGGAVHVFEGDPLIRNCRFILNAANYMGGGVRLEETAATLVGCDFLANRAQGGGGVTSRFGDVSLSGCTFHENSALLGGAIEQYGSVSLTRCVFSSNTAVAVPENPSYSGLGGALLVREEANIANCIFENNAASFGGAIGTSHGSVTLAGCRFTGNVASNRGGALHDIAGDSIVTNCLFTGNRANEGGVLSSDCTGPSMVNCTFADNAATNGQLLAWSWCRPGHGPGYPFTMTFANCILWDGPSQIVQSDSEQLDITMTHSNVFGGWPGAGNIDVDPCFVEPGYWDLAGTPDNPSEDLWIWVDGDYHLKSQAGRWDPVGASWVRDAVASPCIDAGDPNAPIGEEPFPSGAVLNMGAYGGTAEASKTYFGAPACKAHMAGDINGDCKVDLADLLIVISQWSLGVPPTIDERLFVGIVEPVDEASLFLGQWPVLIRAEVENAGSPVASVHFHIRRKVDSAKYDRIFEAQEGPDGWSLQWQMELTHLWSAGEYVIIAEATDQEGLTVASPEITVTVRLVMQR